MNPDLDLDLLSIHMRNKMDEGSHSLRTAAKETGCSAATLSRMLKGSNAPNYPDTKILFSVINWLGKSVADFEKDNIKETTIADVEVHLRALKGLEGKDKEALVGMVKAAYDAASQLRSDKGTKG